MPVHDWTRVGAGTFHGFHTTWAALLGIRLNEILPNEYYAMVENRAFGWEPDVVTLGRNGPDSVNGSERSSNTATHESHAALSLAIAPPKVEMVVSRPANGRQRHIRIRQSDDDRVVAIIEIVSPGNKSSGNAIRAFVAKANEFLERGVNLLIVDLFPVTPRDPDGIHAAIWGASDTPARRTEKPLTLVAYEAGDVERAFIQSVAVGDRLPEMPLCLSSGQYVPVPLEETYTAAFDGFAPRWRDVLSAPTTEGAV